MTKRLVCVAAVFTAVLGCLAITALFADKERKRNLQVDVACDSNSFFSNGPFGQGVPTYGDPFIVQGVIYPAGTFAANGLGSGLNADGTPEFPDKVIGTWICRGWFIGDGILTETGPFVATTQIYELSDGTLVSDGTELIDLNVPFLRAVVGSTGRYSKSCTQVQQTAVGTNATGLFNFTFEFDCHGVGATAK